MRPYVNMTRGITISGCSLISYDSHDPWTAKEIARVVNGCFAPVWPSLDRPSDGGPADERLQQWRVQSSSTLLLLSSASVPSVPSGKRAGTAC